MASSRTQRELQRLQINTNEDQLTPQLNSRQLHRRDIASSTPVPPPRSRSVPASEPEQHAIPQANYSTIHSRAHNPTPMPQHSFGHVDSTALDTTDAKSITNTLLFASQQMKEKYRLDNRETTTPEALSSPSRVADQHLSHTPSTDNDYMIPQRQPQLQGSHDSPNYQSQQRPKNLLGEVYFDFHNRQYKLLHSHESINPLSVIYHEGQDRLLLLWKKSNMEVCNASRPPR